MARTILIIDDEMPVREVLRAMLENEGYHVLDAENGEKGIRLFHKHSPELVITDIIMPEKEGMETICELRRIDRDVKIIAMSGGGRHLAKDYLPLAAQLGAVKTFNKPIERRELITAVRELLGNHP